MYVLFWCTRNILCLKSNKTLYDCDATELSIIYIYLVFVGNGWLALVPSHLPHLRELSLNCCRNVCDKYIKELVTAVPGLVVITNSRCLFGSNEEQTPGN